MPFYDLQRDQSEYQEMTTLKITGGVLSACFVVRTLKLLLSTQFCRLWNVGCSLKQAWEGGINGQYEAQQEAFNQVKANRTV